MRTHYATDLLGMLGVLALTPPEQCTSQRLASIHSRELMRTDADETREDRISFAAIATVLTHLTRLGVGLPTAVVSETGEVLHVILKSALRGLDF